MNKQEFEKLAGYEVTYEDYSQIIEPMYMATNLNKVEFVKCIDKKRFALKTKKQLINELKKMADKVVERVEWDGAHNEIDDLYRKSKEFALRFYQTDKIYFNEGYMYPSIKRGGKFPISLEILNKDYHTIDTIELIPDYNPYSDFF